MMDEFFLKGKIAIVTGAGQGIGKTIAMTFCRAGAQVIAADVNSRSAESTAEQLRTEGGHAFGLSVDAADTAQVEGMIRDTLEKFGRIDVVVNNAGGGVPTKPMLEMTDEDFDGSIRLNLKSTFLCCRAVGRVMARQKAGSIINMSSMAAFGPYPLGAAYSAAKAGVRSLTENLAVELGPYGVRVNALAPGPVETPAVAEYYRQHPEVKAQRLSAIPLQRIATPEEIANVALFLASDASGSVSGQTILINGALPTFVTPEIISEFAKRF
jgi:NAD(P)-dependent dehydrogenase (short-subunit alcohol dehydrogenase family)